MATYRFVFRTVLITAFLVAGSTSISSAGEPNWPQFRGPDGLGIAPDDYTYPATLDPSRNLLWKTEVPLGHSSPCIWGDRIFITAADDKSLETICLDRRNGSMTWRKSIQVEELEKINGSNNHASPTPVCDGTRVYVYFASFGLIAYDLEGGEVWRHPLPIPVKQHGTGCSPILAGGAVIINCDQKKEPYLIAVDKITGKQAWKIERPIVSYIYNWSTPVLWRHGGQTELVVLGCEQLIAYDPATGEMQHFESSDASETFPTNFMWNIFESRDGSESRGRGLCLQSSH